jgi:hypothetical protein
MIVGWQDATLRVRVTAPPVDGAANVAVTRLLAEALGLPRTSISVVSGLHGRSKIVEIAGLGRVEMQRRLDTMLASAS